MQRVTQVSVGVCSPTLDRLSTWSTSIESGSFQKGAGVHRHLQERHNRGHGGEEGAEKIQIPSKSVEVRLGEGTTYLFFVA